MKRTALMVVALALGGCTPPTSLDRAEIEQEIVGARDRVWRAWFTGDSTGLVQALPAAMVGMGETTAEIIANSIGFREAGNRLVALSFVDSEFMLTDTMGVVVSRYRVETVRNDSTTVTEGRAIEVFVREGGSWVNPYWHLDPLATGDTVSN